jgi:hypothetical protein
MLLATGCGSEDGQQTVAAEAPSVVKVDYGSCQEKADAILKYGAADTKITYYTDSAPYYLLTIQFKDASYYLDWEDGASYCNIKSFFF